MPNTPLLGLPYPAATDPVAQGAAAIQALATSLDTKVGLSLIEEKILAADGQFDFTAIPSTYRFLTLYIIARGATGNKGEELRMRVNGDASNHFQNWDGVGSALGNACALGQISGNGMEAKAFGTVVVDIPFYGLAGCYKSWVAAASARTNDSGAGGDWVRSSVHGGWIGSTGPAIDRIQIFGNGTANLKTGSRAALYGGR